MNNSIVLFLAQNEKEEKSLDFYLKNRTIINLFDDIETLNLSQNTINKIIALKKIIAEAIYILSE